MYKMSAERLEGLQKMTQFTPESQSYTHETPGYSKKSNSPPPGGSLLSSTPLHALSMKILYDLVSCSQAHGHAQQNGGFQCEGHSPWGVENIGH